MSKQLVLTSLWDDLFTVLATLERSDILEGFDHPMAENDHLFRLTDKGKETFRANNGATEDYKILLSLIKQAEKVGLLSIGKDNEYTWLMPTEKGLEVGQMVWGVIA